MAAPDGLLVIDKPQDWTSHDVVARSRRLCQTRKVGHAGTLDPMATGVLVLGIGRATRLLTFLVGCDKTYTATIRLGQATVTDDAEGEVTASVDAGDVTPEAVAAAVAALTGEILQRPSSVSAIKVDGQRSYARVRAGEAVELAARPVTVSQFDVLSSTLHRFEVNPPGGARRAHLEPGAVGALVAVEQQVLDLDVVVTVSSGTYVRALARDLGAALGVGGHLTALRRTRVGGFTLESATALEDVVAMVDAGDEPPVIPMARAAEAAFAVRRLTASEAHAVRNGQRIDRPTPPTADPVAGIDPDGVLVAMLDESGERTRSAVVFPEPTS